MPSVSTACPFSPATSTLAVLSSLPLFPFLRSLSLSLVANQTLHLQLSLELNWNKKRTIKKIKGVWSILKSIEKHAYGEIISLNRPHHAGINELREETYAFPSPYSPLYPRCADHCHGAQLGQGNYSPRISELNGVRINYTSMTSFSLSFAVSLPPFALSHRCYFSSLCEVFFFFSLCLFLP